MRTAVQQTVYSKLSGWMRRFASNFLYREYRWYWASVIFAQTAFALQGVVLSWQVLELTDSAFWVGVVAFAYGLPLLILSLFSGFLADRFARRWVIALAVGLAAVSSLFLAVVTWNNVVTPTHILVVSLLIGSAFSLHAPARSALLPGLIPPEIVLSATSLTYSSTRLVGFVGPVAAGFLLARIGMSETLTIQTGLFTVASVLYFRTGSLQTHSVSIRENSYVVWHDVWQFLRNDKPLTTLILLGLVYVPVGMVYLKMMPVFVREVLDEGPAILGLLTGAASLGAALSGFVIVGAGESYRKGRAMLVASTAFGLGLIAFAFTRHTTLALCLIFGVGVFSGVFLTLSNVLLIARPPNQLRGRVNSIWGTVWGLVTFTSLIAGVVAEFWSTTTVFIGIGCIVVLACVIMSFKGTQLQKL